MTSRVLAAAVAGLLTLAGTASAATTPPPKPWATVNVCDTKAHPDAFGVRGSMPGLRHTRTHLYMRVQVQFQFGNGSWEDLKSSGDSGWIDAGKTSRARVQAGRTFTITPPSAGTGAYLLRGRVAFEWRRGTRVLKRAAVYTTGGHRGVQGADPPGYSAATCSIT